MQSKQCITLPSIFPVSAHTNFIGQGSTFVAIHGHKESGTKYIRQAIEQGATTIVIERGTALSSDIKKLIREKNIILTAVDNPRQHLAELSAEKSGYSAQKLKIIGITGTKGKSTTAFLLAHIFQTAGYGTALISSVKNMIHDTTFEAPLTTPQPDYLHQFFAVCVAQGITHVVLEVAAHAISLHRTHGLLFDGIIFTNFSREHLEFYPTLLAYFDTKCALLHQIKPNCPILINGDDLNCDTLEKKYDRFSLKNENCSFFALQKNDSLGISADITAKQGVTFSIHCPALIGTYNLYNILGSVGMALCHGVDQDICQQALNNFQGVPGRFEQYRLKNGALCIIDSAHNPSSFYAILSTLRPLTDNLIVVFGAGGERDARKRPDMGYVARSFADKIILTSDNPRSEKVKKIIEDIISGTTIYDVYKIITTIDREEAIKEAYALSNEKSIIALLGKGNAEYQIVGTKKIKFSEREIIASL